VKAVKAAHVQQLAANTKMWSHSDCERIFSQFSKVFYILCWRCRLWQSENAKYAIHTVTNIHVFSLHTNSKWMFSTERNV